MFRKLLQICQVTIKVHCEKVMGFEDMYMRCKIPFIEHSKIWFLN
jgi:hypothetical protein